MRSLQKIAILMFVSLVCFNVHAGKKDFKNLVKRQENYKNNYQKQDLKQKKQQARFVEKHIEKISTAPKARFEKRHPVKKSVAKKYGHKSGLLSERDFYFFDHETSKSYSSCMKNLAHLPNLTLGQRAIYVFLTLMVLVHKVNGLEKTIPKDKWPSFVHEEKNWDWSSYKTLDSHLSSWEWYECEIRGNYTVTCCAIDPFRCISFYPEGIIGEERESDPFIAGKILYEYENKCKSSYNIAKEARKLLTPKYLQNINQTSCTVKEFDPESHGLNAIVFGQENGIDKRCEVKRWSIGGYEIFNKFQETVSDLADKKTTKYANKKMLFLISDRKDECGIMRYSEAGSVGPFILNSSDGQAKVVKGIIFRYDGLMDYSDQEIEAVIGHELEHPEQFKGSPSMTGNNIEAEADMASVLVTDNPCLIYSLGRVKAHDYYLLSNYVFKGEQKDVLLKTNWCPPYINGPVHPPRYRRNALIAKTYYQFQRAKAWLVATGYESKKNEKIEKDLN